ARGHPRPAGHLPRRARRRSAVRGPAARRLHRRAARPWRIAVRRPVLLGLTLLTDLACAVGPHYHRPDIPMPEGWAEAPAGPRGSQASLAQWWSNFHDATLDGLVARAVDGSLDLKIAAARVREARAARGIAASAGLPQVGVGAAYARTQRSEAVPPFK